VLQYFAVLFLIVTLIVGYFAYRAVRNREGAPHPEDALVGAKG
jgi:membrane protein implicated in regulation of membrane protease activity